MKRIRIQEIIDSLKGLKKEKEREKENRLKERQVEEMEEKRNSHHSFYQDALEFLQDEVKKYWGKLKY